MATAATATRPRTAEDGGAIRGCAMRIRAVLLREANAASRASYSRGSAPGERCRDKACPSVLGGVRPDMRLARWRRAVGVDTGRKIPARRQPEGCRPAQFVTGP